MLLSPDTDTTDHDKKQDGHNDCQADDNDVNNRFLVVVFATISFIGVIMDGYVNLGTCE